jgi:hypothetical protein
MQLMTVQNAPQIFLQEHAIVQNLCLTVFMTTKNAFIVMDIFSPKTHITKSTNQISTQHAKESPIKT